MSSNSRAIDQIFGFANYFTLWASLYVIRMLYELRLDNNEKDERRRHDDHVVSTRDTQSLHDYNQRDDHLYSSRPFHHQDMKESHLYHNAHCLRYYYYYCLVFKVRAIANQKLEMTMMICTRCFSRKSAR